MTILHEVMNRIALAICILHLNSCTFITLNKIIIAKGMSNSQTAYIISDDSLKINFDPNRYVRHLQKDTLFRSLILTEFIVESEREISYDSLKYRIKRKMHPMDFESVKKAQFFYRDFISNELNKGNVVITDLKKQKKRHIIVRKTHYYNFKKQVVEYKSSGKEIYYRTYMTIRF